MSSPAQIQYTIISDEPSFTDSPFCCWAFRIIRFLPNDLTQLEDTLRNYEVSFRAHIKKTFEIFSLPDSFFNQSREELKKSFTSYSEKFNKSIIRVFLIDARIKHHKEISLLMADLENSYCIVSENIEEKFYDPLKEFKNPFQLIKYFKRDINSINKSLSNYYGNSKIQIELAINPSKSFLNDKLTYGHPVNENNSLMLNQIIGTYWIDSSEFSGESVITPPKERINELIGTTKKLDYLQYILRSKFGFSKVNSVDPYYSPLIIVAPYHYPIKPKGKLSKKEKAYNQFLSMEQDFEYQHQSHVPLNKDLSKSEINFLKDQMFNHIFFLDCAAFIHARFTYSPIIRLPQLGKSINLDLSHINKGFSSQKAESQKVDTIGEKLKELLFDKSIIDRIANRDGQIFAISDLPIEWSKLDDLPLCYTHDVCRMPEFNSNALINSAIHYQRFTYTVPKDIIDKTLIIHCASEEDEPMQAMFKVVDQFAVDYSVTTAYCTSVDEIKAKIIELKPELLIFDCHGGFDEKDLSSFLEIDGKKKIYLTGDDIVENSISAPLVFLSACSTMPNYGYLKILSDAFMQAGAYSVTTTFLPIQIIDASTLLIRMISKLNQLKEGVFHSNWLEFISHVLRTALIHESIRKAQIKNRDIKFSHEEISLILAKTMFFEKRKEAIEELNIILKQANLDLTDINNDWLSYSIIGRADLLYFETWVDRIIENKETT